MIVDRALLIPGRQTPVLLQPIDQTLDPLAEAVKGTSKGTGPVFVLLPRDGDADTLASQGLPYLAPTVGFVTYQTTRPPFGAPTPAPFHGSAFHQGFEGHGCVPWARGEAQRHQRAPAVRAEMDFRTEATLTATKRFGLCAPAVGPSRVLVCSDYRAIDIVDSPGQVRCGIRTLLDCRKEASPEARFPPAIKTARPSAPRPIPLGQITPGGAGADAPQDAVQDASVGSGGAAGVRFLRRKQGLSPLPLYIGQVMSVHTMKDTTWTRVCKHALV